jgi:hypothetical protein
MNEWCTVARSGWLRRHQRTAAQRVGKASERFGHCFDTPKAFIAISRKTPRDDKPIKQKVVTG